MNTTQKDISAVKKRKLKGVVVSDKMQKTAVVEVVSMKKHPLYHKYFKQSARYKVHNPHNQYKTGDEVIIQESRPLSREKRWIFSEKIN